MARDIHPTLLAAQRSLIRIPAVRVQMYRPGHPEEKLDLTPFIIDMTVTLPPNFAAGYVQLHVANAGNSITRHDLYKPDYFLDIELGYQKNGVTYLEPVGQFYVDEPQREFTVNPPKNIAVIQARDGMKLLLEKHFEIDEWIDLSAITIREAIQTVCDMVTVSSGVTMSVEFDDDDDTTFLLDHEVQALTASAQDQINTAYELLRQILLIPRLQAFFQGDGSLRVGLMNQMEPIVGTIGGVSALSRPIFGRNHRRSGREHFNVVHVEGDRVFAEAIDQALIDDIGRRKYLFIDDPEIEIIREAEIRALQELDLSNRFREQPDVVVPWLLDIERRDIMEVDDEAVSGLADGIYRVEDIQYQYATGTTPRMEMQIGFGLASSDATTEGDSFA